MTTLPIETAHGVFFARYSEKGLAQLDFPSKTNPKTPSPEADPKTLEWHKITTAALIECLANKSISKLPPLDVSSGTDFQRQVWCELRKVKLGGSVSYGELAERVGKPGAARAVGSACGANPIPVLIPCHRVLPSNGKLGGFSGGLEWKVRLLQLEGIEL